MTEGAGQGHNYGTIHGQNQIFGGTGNRNVVNAQPQTNELRTMVAQLDALLARHRTELADPETAQTYMQMLQEEAAATDPKPNRLTALLSSLTASAGGVTAVAEAIAKVKDLF